LSDEPFLSRWSRRKNEAKVAPPEAQEPAAPEAGAVAASETSQPPPAPEPLPPVESLTPESDFAAFMKPEVDPALKRQAFKKLIEDPRFNVMDGLDVYIDDYSKPDPLPEGWLEKMNAVRYLGIFKEDPPAGPEEAKEAAEPVPAAMPEEARAFPPEPSPPDTPGEPNPPPDVGKSGLFREGI